MPPPTLCNLSDSSDLSEDLTHLQSGSPTARADCSHRSIAVRQNGRWLRRVAGFIGPGYLVAVGYMDPGNWATGLAGGSAFGYQLLWIVMLSNLMAILLQILSARLGIAGGLDLAQACRLHSHPRSCRLQWLLCEIAICATDMAEVIGTAIALNLLFGIPLLFGVVLTAADVLLVLWFQQRGFRYLEAIVMALLLVIFVCFSVNIVLADPQWGHVLDGFVPSRNAITDPAMLYVAIGIIGATVMPHNLYLHSSTVQTRRYSVSYEGKRNAIQCASVDITTALVLAFLVNASIVITAASVFHYNGLREVTEIQQAYRLLTPLTGSALASLLFGLALLASGQSSTLTATLAGQVVMEGYLQLRLPLWLRRLLTRSIAIIPTLIATAAYGETGIARLLILSQVILSLQLPFAVVPLIRYSSDPSIMGPFVNPRWLKGVAWLIAFGIIALNLSMLWTVAVG